MSVWWVAGYSNSSVGVLDYNCYSGMLRQLPQLLGAKTLTTPRVHHRIIGFLLVVS